MHKALLLLKKIPKGKVATYGELARVCKTSPRAIGRIMAGNQHPKEYPCYKVVASDGTLCGYSGRGGLAMKEKLLKKEGIELKHQKVPRKYFHTFRT
jgi:methylated-DNA-[protein]-cysteine S-methyltransferase